MEKINGEVFKVLKLEELKQKAGEIIEIHGIVHKIRVMSNFSFIILRTNRELIQCIYEKEKCNFDILNLVEESSVLIIGKAVMQEAAGMGFEIQIQYIKVLSKPVEISPVTINKKELDVSLDVNLNNRPVSLRNPKQRAIFKIQEGIARGFRDCLLMQGFTEIRTPKIVFAGAEGGANIFKLDYFGKEVFLTQSPQFYKQTMVGIYERVFEVAPVYRAEKHNTSRHLNEYISMDFEMGFINSFNDIMNMEVVVLKYIFNLLNTEYSEELKLLNAKLPEIIDIPAIKFMEAKEILEKEIGRKVTDYYDFEPEEEQLICEYSKKVYNSPFIFITHFPTEKRPFYAMDDKEDPGYTLSFDLLYNGLEITTGGQRIHDYNEQIDKMKLRGMNPKSFESYLMLHKYGVPPHGGIGLGLERLTMKFLGLSNVKEASLFPRDMGRVTP